MVKLITLFYLSSALALGAEHFQMECQKPSVYIGETVQCDFVIYSSHPIVEVEVAKFPEFRGFWKENTMLRQGKIPLFGKGLGSQQPQRGLIASYLLTPMAGEPNPQILPMKLVTKDPFDGGKIEGVLLSENMVLKILPLPPIPNGYPPFKGAVGSFKLEVQPTAFQTDTPTVLRVYLHGTGNFEEINELPVRWPSSIETIGFQAFLQGLGFQKTKVFEWTLTLNDTEDTTLPPIEMSFFNPEMRRYEFIKTPGLRLKHIVAPEQKEQPALTVIAEFEKSSTLYRPWESTPLYITLQFAFSLFLLFYWMTYRSLDLRRSFLTSPARKEKKKWEKVVNAYKHSSDTDFLILAESFARETFLPQGISHPPHTHSAILRGIQIRGLPETLHSAASVIFQNYEKFLFSPERALSMDRKRVLESLITVRKTLPLPSSRNRHI